jgi:hypothetical protein
MLLAMIEFVLLCCRPPGPSGKIAADNRIFKRTLINPEPDIASSKSTERRYGES